MSATHMFFFSVKFWFKIFLTKIVTMRSVSENPLWLPKAPFHLKMTFSGANSRPFTMWQFRPKSPYTPNSTPKPNSLAK